MKQNPKYISIPDICLIWQLLHICVSTLNEMSLFYAVSFFLSFLMVQK